MYVEEIPWRDPRSAFAAFVGEVDAHLLHAGEKTSEPGWSIIVARPTGRLTVFGEKTYIDNILTTYTPFEALAAMIKKRREGWDAAHSLKEAPFFSGLVGFVGYEMGGVLENAAKGPPSPLPFPDMVFGYYDCALLFHRQSERAYIVGVSKEKCEKIRRGHSDSFQAPLLPQGLKSSFSKKEYEAAVEAVIKRILKGDIFQANISQQLVMHSNSGSAYGSFFNLSEDSDARFCAYLQYKEGEIISNSPERFFCTKKNGDEFDIRVEPIKGTRPRGENFEEDQKNAKALLEDKKDRAENIMIADLLRNDLSQICVDDSIIEEALCRLVSYAAVHHMVSIITGKLRHGVTAVDALKVLFPCGSITGAPKIEAMRVIADIEHTGRGPYCGAFGYIDDAGSADFAVAIRTLMATRKSDMSTLTLPVGGGVTLLSNPHKEYEETLTKSQSFLKALSMTGMRPT